MLLHLLSKYSFHLTGTGFIFLCLSLFTLFVIALYSINYLSYENGKTRYWLLFSFFTLGILIATCSSNLETFFVGWEIVGLASFFLIGFYQTNIRSLENSLIALANYKICDVFFVLAIFLKESNQTHLAGACLVLATLAKSAQFPFSSWLYRSLEGPTPSSTIFYGGLALHLGPFLLIQNAMLWDQSPELRLLVGGLGLLSTVYGFIVGSSRSDIKTSLAYASISQVGLIYIELAIGWYHLALWHIIGHNMLRTWNYLRASSFFDDFFKEEHHTSSQFSISIFKKLPETIYFHAFNGFYLDQIFVFMRNFSFLIFMILSLVFSAKHLWQRTFHIEFLVLLTSTFFSIYSFIRPQTKLIYQSFMLILSQCLVLTSIYIFYLEFLESTYVQFSLVFLAGAIWALFPSLKHWHQEMTHPGDSFVGDKNQSDPVSPMRNWIYLFFVISLTASPGSIQFFLQEALFDDLWNHSHTFMILSLVVLTLNSYHFFRLGIFAFSSEILHQPKKEFTFSPLALNKPFK